MIGLLDEVPLGDVLGDGAYDTIDCRVAIYDLGGRQIIPLDKNARLQKRVLFPSLKRKNANHC